MLRYRDTLQTARSAAALVRQPDAGMREYGGVTVTVRMADKD